MVEKYELEVTREQLHVIRESLEAYSRLKAGQFNMVFRDLFSDRYYEGTYNTYTEEMIDSVKQQIFPELNKGAYYGVGSKVYSESTEAWDLMQVCRYQLSWDSLKAQGKEKPEFYSVNYNKPMSFSGKPLAKIRKIDES